MTTVLDELRHTDKLPKAIRNAESALVTMWQTTARAADRIEHLQNALIDIAKQSSHASSRDLGELAKHALKDYQ